MSAEDDIAYEDDPPHPRYNYQNGNAREKKYVDWLVMSLIAGLCWVVYQIKETQSTQAQSIAVLQTLQASQSEQIKDTRAYLEKRMDSVEGRALRGAARDMGLSDANKSQP